MNTTTPASETPLKIMLKDGCYIVVEELHSTVHAAEGHRLRRLTPEEEEFMRAALTASNTALAEARERERVKWLEDRVAQMALDMHEMSQEDNLGN